MKASKGLPSRVLLKHYSLQGVGGGGVLLVFFGASVPSSSPDHDPISDQIYVIFLYLFSDLASKIKPVFRPKWLKNDTIEQ